MNSIPIWNTIGARNITHFPISLKEPWHKVREGGGESEREREREWELSDEENRGLGTEYKWEGSRERNEKDYDLCYGWVEIFIEVGVLESVKETQYPHGFSGQSAWFLRLISSRGCIHIVFNLFYPKYSLYWTYVMIFAMCMRSHEYDKTNEVIFTCMMWQGLKIV